MLRVRYPPAMLLLGTVMAGTAFAADGATVCGRCHFPQTELAARDGGHAPDIDCLSCHDDRRPGLFGPGHQAIPKSCSTHHLSDAAPHPPTSRTLRPARLKRRCLTCHEPHGSPNAHLVRPAIRVRGRLRAVDSGGFVDPAAPGRGLCEVCHRATDFYLASGQGKPHYTDACTVCHDHEAGFRPVATDANCALCHPDEAARLATPNLHHQKFDGACSRCHAEVRPEPGAGHRASAACTDCHSLARVAAHAPGVGIPCTQCHEPHGTANVRLIRDVVHTVAGDDRSVSFDTLTGRADGSFASVTTPGAGLCEICHTRTQFYRADGAATAHYTTSCVRCHPHAAGFLPR